jgi:hypothetical protein
VDGEAIPSALAGQPHIVMRPVRVAPSRLPRPGSQLERERAVHDASNPELLRALEPESPFAFTSTTRPTVVDRMTADHEEVRGYCPGCQARSNVGAAGPAVVIQSAGRWFCFLCRRAGTRYELVDMVLRDAAAVARLIRLQWPGACA